MAVHSAISTIAEVGRQVETGANGVSDNLNTAGDRADDFPLVGDALSNPLRAASEAALDIAGAGHSLDNTASWLAWVLAMAVAAPPILFVAMPWLFLRHPVLPAEVDCDHAGLYAGRRTAARAAGTGQPAADQARGDQRRPGRRLATRGPDRHPQPGRPRTARRRHRPRQPPLANRSRVQTVHCECSTSICVSKMAC